jgi:hypothetical protein
LKKILKLQREKKANSDKCFPAKRFVSVSSKFHLCHCRGWPKCKRCGGHIFMNETRVINCDTSCGLNGKSLRMSSMSQRLFSLSLSLSRPSPVCRNRRSPRKKSLPFSTHVRGKPRPFHVPDATKENTRVYRAVESDANFVWSAKNSECLRTLECLHSESNIRLLVHI